MLFRYSILVINVIIFPKVIELKPNLLIQSFVFSFLCSTFPFLDVIDTGTGWEASEMTIFKMKYHSKPTQGLLNEAYQKNYQVIFLVHHIIKLCTHIF